MAMEIPVYLFTGFLEAGKTKAIHETLADERFNQGEPTLVLMCEDGEGEYDKSAYPNGGSNIFIEEIDDVSMLNSKYLTSLEKKYKIERVMIEYNGMWTLDKLYSAIPKNWLIYQEIYFADAATFEVYNANMRSLVVDKLTNAELIVLNRADKNPDKDAIHKIIRAVSRRINIAYEYSDGNLEYDNEEDPLPFDIEAPIIEIADRDYAIWFRDFAEDIKKYNGKTVKFKGIFGINRKMPEGTAICGRHVMTCCVDDIEFKGLVCVGIPAQAKLKNRDWAIITAKIAMEHHPLYSKVGPVLHVIDIEKSTVPEQEIATFF